MTKIISRDQIVAMGFLLGFEKVTVLDETVLVEDYLRKNPEYSYSMVWHSNLSLYLWTVKNGVTLRRGFKLNYFLQEEKTSVQKYLKKVVGDHFQRYAPKFNLEEYMLRKMDGHYFSEESISYLFCKKQQEALKQMEQKGYINKVWNDDIPHQDFLQYQLSQLGKLQLYKIKYPVMLKDFMVALNAKGYDLDLLVDFLLTQDLERSPEVILTIENFEQFCAIHDRAKEKLKQFTKKK